MAKIKKLPSGINLITSDNPTLYHLEDPATGKVTQHFRSLENLTVAHAAGNVTWVEPSGD